MASVVYFGTKDKQSWIKSPSSGMRSGSVGWSTKTQLLNGRASVRRSAGSHREFSAEWFGNLNSGLDSSLQEIKNYADGLYGDGPYYWVDPYAASQNVLPPHWAAPMLTGKDWPKLAPELSQALVSDPYDNNFPVKTVTYSALDAYESTNKLTLIIPNGYTLHFGWHGPAAAAAYGIRLVPYLRATGLADTAIDAVRLDAGETTRTNTEVDGADYSRVEIFIATDAEQDVEITAMIAQILPTGTVVATGGFIAGKGTTALEFENSPDIEYYSAAIGDGQVGMSANWIEV